MMMVTAPPLVPVMVSITQDTVRSIGIEENAFEKAFNLYPNPSSGELKIQVGKEFIGKRIESKIYNALGEEIPISINFIHSNVANINLSEYSNGIYFVMLHHEGVIYSKRISILK